MTVAEKFGGVRTTTPSGFVIDFEPGAHKYRLNDLPVPAVSDILDVISKPLVAWGQGIGVTGVLKLIQRGDVGRDKQGIPIVVVDANLVTADKDNVVALLKEYSLDHKAVLDAAAARGTAVHKAFEAYLKAGTIPDPQYYPPEHEGYIRGLVKFIGDVKFDKRTKIHSEVSVGSTEHGYAGTFDLLCKLLPCELHTTPIRKKEEFSGHCLLDLKSSSGVWESHRYQLCAYKQAAMESGYRVPEWEAIVRVTEDGMYEVKRNDKTLDGFLTVMAMWKEIKGK